MLNYSKAVVYTVILILMCGLLFVWIARDPSVSEGALFWMTTGGVSLILYTLYRHSYCAQHMSLEGGHVYVGRQKDDLHPEQEYGMVYRSTFLVFSGFQLIARRWRPETGMLVFRKKPTYVPFMSLIDRLFPGSDTNRQVVFFGAWKRPSGEVVSDTEILRGIEAACAHHALVIKDVSLEVELLACALLVACLIGVYVKVGV